MLPETDRKDGEEKDATDEQKVGDEEKPADGVVTPEVKKSGAEASPDKNVEDATADKTVEKAPEAAEEPAVEEPAAEEPAAE